MVVRNMNFTEQDTPSIIDTEYESCNFCFPNCLDDGGVMKGHRIFPGDDTPRTFTNCNLNNRLPPPGSVFDRKIYLIEHTKHVSSDYIDIDGDQIEQKNYADIYYGYYGTDEQYHYEAVPIETEAETPEE